MSEATCLFCAIAAGRVPAHIVYEDEDLVGFLDIRPIRPGHIQLIPRAHYPYFDDLPPVLAARLVTVGQDLARRLKRLYEVERVSFLFTGGDIPHAHAHIVPMVAPTDITSRRYIREEELTFEDLPRMSDEELASIAATLRAETG